MNLKGVMYSENWRDRRTEGLEMLVDTKIRKNKGWYQNFDGTNLKGAGFLTKGNSWFGSGTSVACRL